MDLFHQETMQNLLPMDGEALYFGSIMNRTVADNYFQKLLHEIEWKNDEANLFEKHLITKRKAAWYGDQEYSYTYSNITKKALPWTQELLELKKITESITNNFFNSCLLNLYHSGAEGMAWHSDDEIQLKRDGCIASLTFGATRKFAFKHKETKQTIELILEHGSLLTMNKNTQQHWLHRLPPTTKVKSPRVNLTFRTMI